MAFSFNEVNERHGKPPIPMPNFDPPQVVPVTKPLRELTVGLLASLGVRTPDQPPLAVTNDLTCRKVPLDVPSEDLVFDHETPVRWWADQYINVAFPHDSLRELEAEGTSSRAAPVGVSILGTITLYERLVEETVPKIRDEFEQQNVDLAL